MASVAYVFAGEEPGAFVFHDAEGREHRVESGKRFVTDDPGFQQLLDGSAFVKRAKEKES